MKKKKFRKKNLADATEPKPLKEQTPPKNKYS